MSRDFDRQLPALNAFTGSDIIAVGVNTCYVGREGKWFYCKLYAQNITIQVQKISVTPFQTDLSICEL